MSKQITNREAWHKGYIDGFKGLNPRPDYPLVGLAGSYRLGYEAGMKRRKEPRGPRRKVNARVSNPTISGLKGELLQVDRDIADLEADPFYKEKPGRRAYRAKWLAYHRRQRRQLEGLLRNLERTVQRRNNGIVEAAAGLQALEYIGAKAKRSGLGKKPKYNPERFVVRWGQDGDEKWFLRRAEAQSFASKKKDAVIYSIIKGYLMRLNPDDARFFIQVVKATGGREQFTTNSEKQAREVAASWFSRGASVTIIDRKRKTQTVYGKKNPRVKGFRHADYEQLVKEYGAKKAQRAFHYWIAQPFSFRESVKALPFLRANEYLWNDPKYDNRVDNPHAKGSRDALGVWHVENPTKRRPSSKSVWWNVFYRHSERNQWEFIAAIDAVSSRSAIAKVRKLTSVKGQFKAARKNPSVTDLSRTFQGEANGAIDQLYAADGAPANLARAGKLVFLKVLCEKRPKTFRIPGAVVAIAPNEKLWITGKPPLFATKARKGEGLDAGEVTHICYLTAKAHIGEGKTFEYVHEFGEEGGKRPHLIIDHEGMPILRGGDYKIRAEGIVN